jgi:UDP-glucuronate 4-epimerase
VAERAALVEVFAAFKPQRVVHLAAQAGVRYSITNPDAYIHANIGGMQQMLEACRHHGVEHLTYASSSSVYGLNRKVPYAETDTTDHPVSLYAATKKADEMMAHTYAHLFALPCTGLRFFTVYGPWGRPDMAYFSFTKAIAAGQPIRVFNHGHNVRDFTFVDDIVQGVLAALDHVPRGVAAPEAGNLPTPLSSAPYRVFNLGNDRPHSTLELIAAVEAALGKKAELQLEGPAPGDVEATWADITAARRDLGYAPRTDLATGIARFIAWADGFVPGGVRVKA